MKIILKQPWMGKDAGQEVIVSEDRAWALADAGIAEKPKGKRPEKPKPDEPGDK